jgi:hypothetical protein
MVRRGKVNFLLDAAILLVALAMVQTGLLLRFVLPPGSRGGAGLSLLGWNRHEWGDFHFWLAVTLVSLVALHLVLHWDWVYRTVAARTRRLAGREQPISTRMERLAGVGFFLVLVLLTGGVLWLARTNVTTRGSDGMRAGRGHDIESPAVPDNDGEGSGHRYRGGRP